MTPSEHDYPTSSDDTSVAQVERAQLCDLFEALGPEAPTLSGAWDTHHLAAHLVVREGNPIAAIKMLGGGRSGDAEVDRVVETTEFATLVEQIRGGPPRMSVFGTGLTDKHLNGLEYLVHHEDVRRAQPDFGQRVLPAWALDEAWSGFGLALRGLMRKAPVGVALRRNDTGQLRVGSKKPRAVVVAGPPVELILFAFGRGAVANVTFDGAPADVASLESAHFGF